jgi:hypothetical protein
MSLSKFTQSNEYPAGERSEIVSRGRKPSVARSPQFVPPWQRGFSHAAASNPTLTIAALSLRAAAPIVRAIQA